MINRFAVNPSMTAAGSGFVFVRCVFCFTLWRGSTGPRRARAPRRGAQHTRSPHARPGRRGVCSGRSPLHRVRQDTQRTKTNPHPHRTVRVRTTRFHSALPRRVHFRHAPVQHEQLSTATLSTSHWSEVHVSDMHHSQHEAGRRRLTKTSSGITTRLSSLYS